MVVIRVATLWAFWRTLSLDILFESPNFNIGSAGIMLRPRKAASVVSGNLFAIIFLKHRAYDKFSLCMIKI